MVGINLNLPTVLQSKFRIDRYANDEDFKIGKSYNTTEFIKNKFLVEGMNEIWALVTGTPSGAVQYSYTYARIGVGTATTGEDESQAGLLCPNPEYGTMTSSWYPDTNTDKTVIFQSTFGSASANFDWREFTVDNGSVRNKNINRKQENQGTKVSGQIWVITVTLSLANP